MFEQVPKTFMLAAQRTGMMSKPPPRKITQRALNRLGVRRSRRANDRSTMAAHLGYGSASGALFNRTVRGRVLPRMQVVEGLWFGSAVRNAA